MLNSIEKAKKFEKNEDGNVAMMFAIVLSLFMLLIGAAIDYGNMIRLQNQLQAQVDAGVLAAATADVKGDVDLDFDENDPRGGERKVRQEAAISVIKANGFDTSALTPKMTLLDKSVLLSAEISYTPFFGKFIGQEKVTLSAESESGLAGIASVELVLVLDNTDSMRVDGKMDALKTGASNLVKAIETSDSESKIGIVPFSRYVRVHDGARAESWFEMPVEYETVRNYDRRVRTGGTCVEVTRTREIDGVEETYQTNECTGQTTTYEPATRTFDSYWEGCVGVRAAPLDEQDGSYYNKIPGLLRVIPSEASDVSWDHWTGCPAEIVPMTDNYKTLEDRIKGLWPTDVTYLPSGLIWGQRVLSPGEPYDNQNEAGAQQIMVLMTDGKNTSDTTPDSHQGEFGGFPYIREVEDASAGSPVADQATARLCSAIKTSGIEIYTIAFQVTDVSTKTLLRNCASDPENALVAGDNASLIKQFETISQAIKEDVRLMR